MKWPRSEVPCSYAVSHQAAAATSACGESLLQCAITSNRIGAYTDTDHTVPYGTALLGWRFRRHFVPGYNRTVPPGHFATGSPQQLVVERPKRDYLFFSKRFRNRQSHAGASWLINSIERPYPFCSIPPKETENAKAPEEPNTSMTLAAQPWNVRRAWMPPWLNESQRPIESVLAKSYWLES
jgi:hypothetical protein